jgi:hypothetical protein
VKGTTPNERDEVLFALPLEILDDELSYDAIVKAADRNEKGPIEVIGGFPRPFAGLYLSANTLVHPR